MDQAVVLFTEESHHPPAVAEVAAQNKAVVYGLLFRTVAETLRTIAADPRHLGAEIGFFAVLHTWGQTLVHHPHLHCVIPGGGLANDGSGWVACRPGFFLPVRVLSRYFRRVLLAELEDAFESGQLHFAGRLQPLADPTCSAATEVNRQFLGQDFHYHQLSPRRKDVLPAKSVRPSKPPRCMTTCRSASGLGASAHDMTSSAPRFAEADRGLLAQDPERLLFTGYGRPKSRNAAGE